MITPTHSSVLLFPFVLCPHTTHSLSLPLALFISLSFYFFPFYFLLLQFLLSFCLSHPCFSCLSLLLVIQCQRESILQSIVQSVRPTVSAVLQNVTQSGSCQSVSPFGSDITWQQATGRNTKPTMFPAQHTHNWWQLADRRKIFVIMKKIVLFFFKSALCLNICKYLLITLFSSSPSYHYSHRFIFINKPYVLQPSGLNIIGSVGYLYVSCICRYIYAF